MRSTTEHPHPRAETARTGSTAIGLIRLTCQIWRTATRLGHGLHAHSLSRTGERSLAVCRWTIPGLLDPRQKTIGAFLRARFDDQAQIIGSQTIKVVPFGLQGEVWHPVTAGVGHATGHIIEYWGTGIDHFVRDRGTHHRSKVLAHRECRRRTARRDERIKAQELLNAVHSAQAPVLVGGFCHYFAVTICLPCKVLHGSGGYT